MTTDGAAPDPLGWLSSTQRGFVRAAEATIAAEDTRGLVTAMVDLASPTGRERALVVEVQRRLRTAGLDSLLLTDGRDDASLLARLPGVTSNLAPLLLYAPVDTHATGDPARDVPWVAPTLREDMVARATQRGDLVLGLGACNPKGHAAAVVLAVTALRTSGVPLMRGVLLGLGGRGMPIGDPRTDPSAGHGRGCELVLDAAGPLGAAVVAKPGGVAWDEVGVAILRVQVHGGLGYVGVRHRGGHHNPIVAAASVIHLLEQWFEEYRMRHRSDTAEPQAVVGAVHAGHLGAPTFTPAVCELTIDLRLAPAAAVGTVLEEFEHRLQWIGTQIDCDVEWELVHAVPGTHTDPNDPVVTTAVQAWESVTGDRHRAPSHKSGATDANVIRARGVPTVRVGMPRVPPEVMPVPDDFSAGMNVVSLTQVDRLAMVMVRSAVAMCT